MELLLGEWIKMKSKVTLINMISALLLQACIIISGFIIPKIILIYFGSDVNGLVSSINQFLSYIALLEGGITGVISANIYKPLVEHDFKKLSSVIVTSKQFYNKIALIFVVYSIVLAILYPVFFNTKFTSLYIFILTIILSILTIIQYMFSLTLKTLLIADKKAYIVSFSQIVIVILNITLVYISVRVYPSIHLLKLISGCLFIIQPIVYTHYTNKYYTIDWTSKSDNNLISERWNGFAINIAAFIHNSTDITILTIFTNLATVSIYSVYTLVTTGIKSLINALLSGINPVIGQVYAKKDLKELNNKMDLYEYIVLLLVFFMFSIAGLLITPFVTLYTKGISDANYYQPIFGVLTVVSEALYLVKFPHLNLAYSANKFKEITIPAYIEAVINIVLSVILVNWFGLIGVSIGTIVAMVYRMAFHIYYTSTIVKGRNQLIFYKKIITFLIATIIGMCICIIMFPMYTITISNWIIHALVYSIVFAFLYFIISIIWFKKELLYIKVYINKKKR